MDKEKKHKEGKHEKKYHHEKKHEDKKHSEERHDAKKHDDEKNDHKKHHEKDKEEKKSCSSGKCFLGVKKEHKPLIILGLSVFFLIVISMIFLLSKKDSRNFISLEEARVKAENFINENFSDPNNPLSVVSIEESTIKGLYMVRVDIGQEEPIESYISKDGKKFFPQAFNMDELEQGLNNTGAADTGNEPQNEAAAPQAPTVLPERFNESAPFETTAKVPVYFFWGEGCPFGNNQKTAMEQWLERYTDADIEIKTYETWNNDNNRTTLESMAAAYNTVVGGVPMTFIGDQYWVGFSAEMEAEMLAKIDQCIETPCENPGERIQQ